MRRSKLSPVVSASCDLDGRGRVTVTTSMLISQIAFPTDVACTMENDIAMKLQIRLHSNQIQSNR